MKSTAKKVAAKKASPKKAAPKTKAPAKKANAAPKKSVAKKVPAKKVATKKPLAKKAASSTNPRSGALEATGLAEQVLRGRGIEADVALLETKGAPFYALVRVKVEDLPALLG